MTPNSSESMTIGRLARAAGVGVETIRYYQQRGLLPVPASMGAFRQYPVALAARIHFIKRAQELGFSLIEITELLRLEDGAHRSSIRRIASDRLAQIGEKVADLKRMQKTLKHLVAECEHTGGDLPCPIIASLVQPGGTAQPGHSTDSLAVRQAANRTTTTSSSPASVRTGRSPFSAPR